MNNPKLTIITINLNNATGLRKTIESVVSQTYSDFEYIIIDGCSTDGSVEVVKEYQEKITYWVSESDKGIYNAMNKGILKATGEYCLFLNSGDWLYDEKVIEDFLHSYQNEEIICGKMAYVENGKIVIYKPPSKDELSLLSFFNNSLPHQAAFIKKNLFSQYGIYNETYKINSDKDFFLKILVVNNCTYNYFDRIISHFDRSGISSQHAFSQTLIEEDNQVILSNIYPLVYKSFKTLYEENIKMKSLYEEYILLKSGKFRLIIQILIWFKAIKKKLSKNKLIDP